MTLQFSPQTRRVFHLSLPIFAELLLQLLVGNMDQFMISHFGSAAVAAIGNGNQVMNVVIIVLTTMSTAATILLTQHIGAGRVGGECSEIVTVAVTVSAVFSFLVGLFLLLEPELVFQLLRTPEDAFDGACLYTRIVGGTVLLQGLYIQLCAVLRSYTLLKEVVVLSVSMNLLNKGYVADDEIERFPGVTHQKGIHPVIECTQNIPCNPCQDACKKGCIRIGKNITSLPAIDPDKKCIGCGMCVASCSGQSIFLVEEDVEEGYGEVTMPYEFLPLPEKGEKGYGMSRSGEKICDAEVVSVRTSKAFDHTNLLTIKVPADMAMKARFYRKAEA